MYEDSGILLSALPIPIVTYDAIVYPFDQQVWSFMFACVIAKFLLLQAMQYLYCKVSGTPNDMEYIYAGIQYKFISKGQISSIVFLQIFSLPWNWFPGED